jgi:hypothetical protein
MAASFARAPEVHLTGAEDGADEEAGSKKPSKVSVPFTHDASGIYWAEGRMEDLESSCDEGGAEHEARHGWTREIDGVGLVGRGQRRHPPSPRRRTPSAPPSPFVGGSPGRAPAPSSPQMAWAVGGGGGGGGGGKPDARASLSELERMQREAHMRRIGLADHHHRDDGGDGRRRRNREGNGGGGGTWGIDSDEEHEDTLALVTTEGRRVTPRIECFGCTYGNIIYDSEINRNMAGLYAIFVECIINTDIPVVCRMMHAYFMEQIYTPAQELRRIRPLDYDIPKWTTQQIYDHFMHHSQDPRIKCLRDIIRFNRVEDFLDQHTKLVNEETGRVEPNLRVLKELRETNKHNWAIRNNLKNFSGMFGFDKNLNIDMGRMGDVVARNKIRNERVPLDDLGLD